MNQEKNQSSLSNSEVSAFEQKPDPNTLSKQQKISLISLGVFSVLIMVFGILQFQYNLYSPFDYSRQIAANQKNNASGNASGVTTTDLTKLDSDNDGLNDFDEINVYKTSPYLEDSDSDGFSDKDEILNSTDPNCPTGQVCAQITTNTDSSSSNSLTPDSLDNPISAEINQVDKTAQDMLSGKSDPAVLRKLLLDNGMEKTELDQISDEDLILSYQESLKKQQEAQAQQ
ncbi:MAG: hypothetical protein WCJ57_03905 [Candidatus Falkowbacteria bacterium]